MKSEYRLHRIVVCALAMLMTLSAAVGGSDRKLHVRVLEDEVSDPIEVSVPLRLAELAMKVIPEDVLEPSIESTVIIGFPKGAVGAHADVNDVSFALDAFRELWQEVRRSPDGAFVTVETEDETVEAAISGKNLVIRAVETDEAGSQVDVEIPLEVVDALFSGSESRLDLAAAVRALGSQRGEISIRDGTNAVRIWVE